MARLRFPGRPGYRFGRLGVRYGGLEPHAKLDAATQLIANIHRGLRHFCEQFGESDEDEFDGFSEDEVKKVAKRLSTITATLAATCKMVLPVPKTYPKPSTELSRTRLSQGGTGQKVCKSYRDMVRYGRDDNKVPVGSHLKRINKKGGVSKVKQGAVHVRRGRPPVCKVESDDESDNYSLAYLSKQSKFSSKKKKDRSIARQLLVKAKTSGVGKTNHSVHKRSGSSEKKLTPPPPRRFLQFVLPTVSSRSARRIIPNKRFLDDSYGDITPVFKSPRFVDSAVEQSAATVVSPVNEPAATTDAAAAATESKSVLFEQPLVVSGKRQRKPSDKLIRKLSEADADAVPVADDSMSAAKRKGRTILQKAKLCLNQAAVNRSKAALARSLKRKMRRELVANHAANAAASQSGSMNFAQHTSVFSTTTSPKFGKDATGLGGGFQSAIRLCVVCGTSGCKAWKYNGHDACQSCVRYHARHCFKVLKYGASFVCKKDGNCPVKMVTGRGRCKGCWYRHCVEAFGPPRELPKPRRLKVDEGEPASGEKEAEPIKEAELSDTEDTTDCVEDTADIQEDVQPDMCFTTVKDASPIPPSTPSCPDPTDEESDLRLYLDPSPTPDASPGEVVTGHVPRIKHVCRRAAVALGSPATFPRSPRRLRLSALPSPEKRELLSKNEYSSDSDEMSMEEIIRQAHDDKDHVITVKRMPNKAFSALVPKANRPEKPSNDAVPTWKIRRSGIGRKRRVRCRKCPGCLAEDCGSCVACLDMLKFGGRGVVKQACRSRICKNPVYASDLTQHQKRIKRLNKLALKTIGANVKDDDDDNNDKDDGNEKDNDFCNAKGSSELGSKLAPAGRGLAPRGRGQRGRGRWGRGVKITRPQRQTAVNVVRPAETQQQQQQQQQVVSRSPSHHHRSSRTDIGARLKVDFEDDYDIDTAWRHGVALISSTPLCLRMVCRLCGSAGSEQLIFCSVCCEPFHSFCLEDTEKPATQHLSHWCCSRCQFCHVCGRQNNLLKCDKCQDTYHAECLGPNYPTKPSKKKKIWICTKCVHCRSCGATTPGNNKEATWTHDFSLCYQCGELMEKGNFCPICHKCYGDDDWDCKMIQCSSCESWVHAKCEGLTDEMYNVVTYMPDDVTFFCRVCLPSGRGQTWSSLVERDMRDGMRSVMHALLNSRSVNHIRAIHTPTPEEKNSEKSTSDSGDIGRNTPATADNRSRTPEQISDSMDVDLAPSAELPLENASEMGTAVVLEDPDASQKPVVIDTLPEEPSCAESTDAVGAEETSSDVITAVLVPGDDEVGTALISGLLQADAATGDQLLSLDDAEAPVISTVVLPEDADLEMVTAALISGDLDVSYLLPAETAAGCEGDDIGAAAEDSSNELGEVENNAQYLSVVPDAGVTTGDDGVDTVCVIGDCGSVQSGSSAGKHTAAADLMCEDVLSAETSTCSSSDKVLPAMQCEDERTAMHSGDEGSEMHHGNEGTAMHYGDERTSVLCGDERTALPSEDEGTTVHSGDEGTAMHSGCEDIATCSGDECIAVLSVDKVTKMQSLNKDAEMHSVDEIVEKATGEGADVDSRDEDIVMHSTDENTTMNSGKDSTAMHCGYGSALSNVVISQDNSVASLNTSLVVSSNIMSSDHKATKCVDEPVSGPLTTNYLTSLAEEKPRDHEGTKAQDCVSNDKCELDDHGRSGIEDMTVGRADSQLSAASSSTLTAPDILPLSDSQDDEEEDILPCPARLDFPCDLQAVNEKLNFRGYSNLESFSDDIVRIIQHNLLLQDSLAAHQKKASDTFSSIFIKHMKQNFPWFSVKSSRLWEHNKNLPNGMLPDATIPPTDDHTYAQWMIRDEKLKSPQPSPFKKIPNTPMKRPVRPMASLDEDCQTVSDVLTDDIRRCVFCSEYGDGKMNETGRLLYAGHDEWVHVNCALWSAEVFEEVDGTLQHVQGAIKRGRKMRCEPCGCYGATVGCCQRGCPATFHFMCARRARCVFQEDKKVYCYAHRCSIDGEVVDKNGFEVLRRSCVEQDKRWVKKTWQAGLAKESINVLAGSMTLESLGYIGSLSDCKRSLYPIDYCVSRVYWSTRDARRRCIYTCRIIQVAPADTTLPEVVVSDVRIVHDMSHEDYDAKLLQQFMAAQLARRENAEKARRQEEERRQRSAAQTDTQTDTQSTRVKVKPRMKRVSRKMSRTQCNLDAVFDKESTDSRLASSGHELTIDSNELNGTVPEPVISRVDPSPAEQDTDRPASAPQQQHASGVDLSCLSASTRRLLSQAKLSVPSPSPQPEEESHLTAIVDRLNRAASENKKRRSREGSVDSQTGSADSKNASREGSVERFQRIPETRTDRSPSMVSTSASAIQQISRPASLPYTGSASWPAIRPANLPGVHTSLQPANRPASLPAKWPGRSILRPSSFSSQQSTNIRHPVIHTVVSQAASVQTDRPFGCVRSARPQIRPSTNTTTSSSLFRPLNCSQPRPSSQKDNVTTTTTIHESVEKCSLPSNKQACQYTKPHTTHAARFPQSQSSSAFKTVTTASGNCHILKWRPDLHGAGDNQNNPLGRSSVVINTNRACTQVRQATVTRPPSPFNQLAESGSIDGVGPKHEPQRLRHHSIGSHEDTSSCSASQSSTKPFMKVNAEPSLGHTQPSVNHAKSSVNNTKPSFLDAFMAHINSTPTQPVQMYANAMPVGDADGKSNQIIQLDGSRDVKPSSRQDQRLRDEMVQKIKAESLARSSVSECGPFKCAKCKRLYRTHDSWQKHASVCDFEVSTSEEDDDEDDDDDDDDDSGHTPQTTTVSVNCANSIRTSVCKNDTNGHCMSPTVQLCKTYPFREPHHCRLPSRSCSSSASSVAIPKVDCEKPAKKVAISVLPTVRRRSQRRLSNGRAVDLRSAVLMSTDSMQSEKQTYRSAENGNTSARELRSRTRSFSNRIDLHETFINLCSSEDSLTDAEERDTVVAEENVVEKLPADEIDDAVSCNTQCSLTAAVNDTPGIVQGNNDIAAIVQDGNSFIQQEDNTSTDEQTDTCTSGPDRFSSTIVQDDTMAVDLADQDDDCCAADADSATLRHDEMRRVFTIVNIPGNATASASCSSVHVSSPKGEVSSDLEQQSQPIIEPDDLSAVSEMASTELCQAVSASESDEEVFFDAPEVLESPAAAPCEAPQESCEAPQESREMIPDVQESRAAPQELCEVPQKSREAPQESNEAPQESFDALQDVQESCEAPQDLCEIPQDSCEAPQESCGAPQESCEAPQELCDVPQNPCEVPQEFCKVPQESCEAPQLSDVPQELCDVPKKLREASHELCEVQQDSCEAPQKSCEALQESCEAPQESCEAPQESCEAPQESCKAPQELCDVPQKPCEAPQELCELQQESCEAHDIQESYEAPQKSQKALHESSEARQEVCEASEEWREAPDKSGDALQELYEAPHQSREIMQDSVETLQKSCETSKDLCGASEESCEAPQKSCEASQELHEAQQEESCEVPQELQQESQESCAKPSNDKHEAEEQSKKVTELSHAEPSRTIGEPVIELKELLSEPTNMLKEKVTEIERPVTEHKAGLPDLPLPMTKLKKLLTGQQGPSERLRDQHEPIKPAVSSSSPLVISASMVANVDQVKPLGNLRSIAPVLPPSLQHLQASGQLNYFGSFSVAGDQQVVPLSVTDSRVTPQLVQALATMPEKCRLLQRGSTSVKPSDARDAAQVPSSCDNAKSVATSLTGHTVTRTSTCTVIQLNRPPQATNAMADVHSDNAEPQTGVKSAGVVKPLTGAQHRPVPNLLSRHGAGLKYKHSTSSSQELHKGGLRKDYANALKKKAVGRPRKQQHRVLAELAKEDQLLDHGYHGAHPLIHPAHQHPFLPEATEEEEVRDTLPFQQPQDDEPGSTTTKPSHNAPRLVFDITSDDGFHVQADSWAEAWKAVTDAVQDARANAHMKPLSFCGVSGLKMFGLTHDAIIYLIEQLSGASRCRNYHFKYHRYYGDEADEVPENPSGCARSEPFASRKPSEMFSFLLSKYRNKPEYDASSTREEEMVHKSQRRKTSMDLPMAMRFRHLRNNAKQACNVFRSAIHGRGLFCKRDIDAGEMIIEYAGQVIRATLTDQRENYYESKGIGCYMFRIDDDDVVDATIKGNAARFINHCCEPNCYSKVIQVDGKKHIIIFAMRPIKRGEELTYDYKFPIEDVKIPCSCGAKRCRRYLN